MLALAQFLEAQGLALSQQVLGDRYRDPFWSARFGDRGRRHADEDSAFHLRYLARALDTGDDGVLVRYARWLREVLASRGMCTRHLAENFRLLANGIAARGWPDHAWAVACLDKARTALAYPFGPPGVVQSLEKPASDSTATPYAADPDIYLSYLADALALGSSATFVAHVRWTRDWIARTGEAPDAMQAALAEVSRRVDGSPACDPAAQWLAEAQAAPEAAPR